MKMFLLMEHHQIVNIFQKNVNINIYYAIIVNTVIILYVLLIVNVNRNKLNVNGSKCKCTCNIVIFKELIYIGSILVRPSILVKFKCRINNTTGY